MVEEYEENSSLEWRLDTTFVTFIQKINDVKSVSDYRPIGLLSRVYMIIGKALTERLLGMYLAIKSKKES